MFDDLPVGYAHYVHARGLDPPACSSDAHELSLLGAAQESTEGQLVILLYAVHFGHAQVREGLAHSGQPQPDALGGRHLLGKWMLADPRLVDPAADNAIELATVPPRGRWALAPRTHQSGFHTPSSG